MQSRKVSLKHCKDTKNYRTFNKYEFLKSDFFGIFASFILSFKMRQIRLLTAFLMLFLMPFLLYAQSMERFRIGPKGWGIKLKPEIAISAGISLPFGKYAALSDLANEKGSAGLGYFTELRFVQRNSTKPLFYLQFTAGYMRHSFKEKAVLDSFHLAAFVAKPWDILYLMPGLGFKGGKDLVFELHASFGALVYNGWNARRAVFNKLNGLDSYEWQFKRSVGAAIRFSNFWGYKINKKCTIFAEGTVLLGRGRREGTRWKKTYLVDAVHQVAIEPPISSLEQTILHSAYFSTFNIGLGIKYALYKYLHDPNQRHWRYY